MFDPFDNPNGALDTVAESSQRFLIAIGQVCRTCHHVGDSINIPHLLHLKADIFLQAQVSSENDGAEHLLLKALEWSRRRQGALAYEHGVAMSLVEVRTRQGRAAEGTDLVRAVYSRFTEGLDTADLRRTRQSLSVNRVQILQAE
jgi:hypothetical protein